MCGWWKKRKAKKKAEKWKKDAAAFGVDVDDDPNSRGGCMNLKKRLKDSDDDLVKPLPPRREIPTAVPTTAPSFDDECIDVENPPTENSEKPPSPTTPAPKTDTNTSEPTPKPPSQLKKPNLIPKGPVPRHHRRRRAQSRKQKKRSSGEDCSSPVGGPGQIGHFYYMPGPKVSDIQEMIRQVEGKPSTVAQPFPQQPVVMPASQPVVLPAAQPIAMQPQLQPEASTTTMPQQSQQSQGQKGQQDSNQKSTPKPKLSPSKSKKPPTQRNRITWLWFHSVVRWLLPNRRPQPPIITSDEPGPRSREDRGETMSRFSRMWFHIFTSRRVPKGLRRTK